MSTALTLKAASALAAAALLALGLAAAGENPFHDDIARPTPTVSLPACLYDDGTPPDGYNECYWDAKSMGVSFVGHRHNH